MKVYELIERLSQFDEDSEVYIAFPSGDYWGTTCASKVDEVSIGDVEWSDYHRQSKIVDNPSEDSVQAVILE